MKEEEGRGQTQKVTGFQSPKAGSVCIAAPRVPGKENHLVAVNTTGGIIRTVTPVKTRVVVPGSPNRLVRPAAVLPHH